MGGIDTCIYIYIFINLFVYEVVEGTRALLRALTIYVHMYPFCFPSYEPV